MKIFTGTLLCGLILTVCFESVAQEPAATFTTTQVANSNVKGSNPTAPSDAFYTEVQLEGSQCISSDERERMWNRVQENISSLRTANPQLGRRQGASHPHFIWPVQADSSFSDYGYYTVNFLVDHDPGFGNQLEDYNCGDRTYDWGSGNHTGTDIILWPYPWKRMDEQVMEIVAAAPGVIVSKVDGNFDRNCANNGQGTWNDIHLLHDDGSISKYLHFKSGSLTSKIIGDSVVAGEYLGTAGSSGSSNWPHLHFEVSDSSGNLIDPYDGSCNSLNAGDTWWMSQHNYNVPAVNRICTKSKPVDYYSCPNPEFTYEQVNFDIGDTLTLFLYMRDLVNNTDIQVNLYDPSMVNQLNWSFTVPWATATTSYVSWYYIVDNWWTPGWWTFEAVYEGQTYQTQYYMTGTAASVQEHGGISQLHVSPNPVKDMLSINDHNLKGEVVIELFDLSGRKLMDQIIIADDAAIKLNTEWISEGVYLLHVSCGDQRFLNRIMKQ